MDTDLHPALSITTPWQAVFDADCAEGIPNLVRYSLYRFWILEVGDLRMKGFDNGVSCGAADRP
jgi:hypothetical protein